MDEELPDDLAGLWQWAQEALEAAGDLFEGREINKSREQLIQLLINEPTTTSSLESELVVASEPLLDRGQASIHGRPGAHILDAICELCWHVLGLSLRSTMQEMESIIARNCSWASAKEPSWFLAREDLYKLKKPIEAIRAVLKDPAALEERAPDFAEFARRWPMRGSPNAADHYLGTVGQATFDHRSLRTLLRRVLLVILHARAEQESRSRYGSARKPKDQKADKAEKRRRGPQRSHDPLDDDKLVRRWKEWREQNPHGTYEDFAHATGEAKTGDDLKKALDRVRIRERQKRIRPIEERSNSTE